MNIQINLSITEATEILANYYKQSYSSDAVKVVIDAPKAVDSRKIHSILMLKWFKFMNEYKFEWDESSTVCTNKIEAIKDFRDLVAADGFHIDLLEAKCLVEEFISFN